MDSKLSKVSDTLYVPLLGRIYASNNHKNILYDEKALEVSESLPSELFLDNGQNEYTYIASAVRSTNIDYYVKKFLDQNPNGSVVNLGCGLEDIYDRIDNGTANWFELDLPNVLELRKQYFPPSERDHYLPYSILDYTWIDELKKLTSEKVIFVASGLFHYFKEKDVIELLRKISELPDCEIVFDAVSSAGMKITHRYMKKMGREDAFMYFSVDNAEELVKKINTNMKLIESRKYYSIIKTKKSLSFSTKFKMIFSDTFNMVKMVHLRNK